MSIGTTLSVEKNTAMRIKKFSDKSGFSKRQVIEWVLIKMSKYDVNHASFETQVRYQPRENGELIPVSVRYTKEVYEIVQDLRKICKMSVSLILFLGMQIFGSEFVRKFIDRSDGANTYAPSYGWKYVLESDSTVWSFTRSTPLQEKIEEMSPPDT